MREFRFTILMNTTERAALEALAERLKRTQSDAIRWLVVEAAREIGAVKASVEHAQTTQPQPVHEGVS